MDLGGVRTVKKGKKKSLPPRSSKTGKFLKKSRTSKSRSSKRCPNGSHAKRACYKSKSKSKR